MKKQFFIKFMLCAVFLFQSVSAASVLQVFGYLFGQAQQNAVSEQMRVTNVEKKYENDIKSKSYAMNLLNEHSLVVQELKEEISDRIDAIINAKVVSNGNYYLFPTANSKIFVLNNIQDFFDFKFPQLNAFVYEECVKKIHDLQQGLDKQIKEENVWINGKRFQGVEKEYYVDKVPYFRAIDDFRDTYLKEYGLSVSELKKMEAIGKKNKEQLNRWLEAKIQQVKNGLQEFIKTTAKATMNAANEPYRYERYPYDQQKKAIESWEKIGNLDENSPQYRAYMSILAHLIYWKAAAKPQMFLGTQLNERLEKVAAMKQEQKQYEEVSPTAEEDRARSAASTRYGKIGFLSQKAAMAKEMQAGRVPKIYTEEELGQQEAMRRQPKRLTFMQRIWQYLGY